MLEPNEFASSPVTRSVQLASYPVKLPLLQWVSIRSRICIVLVSRGLFAQATRGVTGEIDSAADGAERC